MPRLLITAYDGTDAQAPTRHRDARPAHIEGARVMAERGEIIAGGALLDDAGGPIGSAVVVEFPSRADPDARLARDPYVTQGVWQRVEVRPMLVAVRAP